MITFSQGQKSGLHGGHTVIICYFYEYNDLYNLFDIITFMITYTYNIGVHLYRIHQIYNITISSLAKYDSVLLLKYNSHTIALFL